MVCLTPEISGRHQSKYRPNLLHIKELEKVQHLNQSNVEDKEPNQ